VGGGGTLELNGKAGPIPSDNVETTPLTAALKIAGFELAQAVDGMAGIGAFDGNAESNGRAVQIKGRLKAEKLRFGKDAKPADRPVEFAFAVDHNLKTHGGRLSQGDIKIGAAAATLTGTYTESALRMRLAGPSMAVPELAAMLPAMGVVLPAGSSLQGGIASLKAELEGPTNRLVTSGTVDIAKTTLAGFDLGKKMTVIQSLAGIKAGSGTEIETLSAAFRMSPEGIRAETLRLIVPTIGELSGGGAIDPANALDFKMTAKVHTAGMLASVSDAPIPFLVTGTASDPVFRPDVKAVVSEKAKSAGTKAAQGLLNRFLGGKKN
jgi:AsmA protein